jgi:hypothetical protein
MAVVTSKTFIPLASIELQDIIQRCGVIGTRWRLLPRPAFLADLFKERRQVIERVDLLEVAERMGNPQEVAQEGGPLGWFLGVECRRQSERPALDAKTFTTAIHHCARRPGVFGRVFPLPLELIDHPAAFPAVEADL